MSSRTPNSSVCSMEVRASLPKVDFKRGAKNNRVGVHGAMADPACGLRGVPGLVASFGLNPFADGRFAPRALAFQQSDPRAGQGPGFQARRIVPGAQADAHAYLRRDPLATELLNIPPVP